MTCNRHAHDQCLFAGMVWLRTNSHPLSFWCWACRIAAPPASRPPHHAPPATPVQAPILPDAARSRTTANGAVPPVCLGTVRCTLSMHVVFLHHPMASFALRAADHINEVARLKLCDVQVHFAIRQIGLQSKL